MVAVENLSFRYRANGADTLDGLSFAIAQGEIFGFLGPSGAGKSTTQRILTGLIRSYRGRVEINGSAPAAQGRSFYENVGVAFETPNLYPKLTARENLDFFRSLYRGATADPIKLLDRVGLRDDADRTVGRFSKGMRIRLNLCRALLNRPRLLFLDEPTAGLDPLVARRVRTVIEETRAAGTTIFLTTHNMTLADELCDRVGFLVDGRLALIDAPAELRRRFGRAALRVEHAVEGRNESEEFELATLAEDERFQALLAARTIRTMHTLETTLEEVFIRTTGRELA